MAKKVSKYTKSNIITYGAIVIIFAIVQFMVNAGSVPSLIQGLLVPLCTYSILAVSLNLVVGISGELSLGHAGFMCIGAFVGATFSKMNATSISNDVLRFIIATVLAAVIAGIFGFLIGIPVLRLRGDYLAIVTLAFGEIIKNVVNVIYLGVDSKGLHFCITKASDLNMESDGKLIINGATGITGTPHSSSFLIGIILLIITLIIVQNLINSRSGRAIMAIRDNRIAAESIGINITKYKLMAFSISAMLAGVAGSLYAHNLSTLTATSKNFGYNMSIMILVFVVLGGIGKIQGSIVAAVILTLLPELLRGLNDYRMLMYAILLIAMMLFNSSPSGMKIKATVLSKFSKKKGEA